MQMERVLISSESWKESDRRDRCGRSESDTAQGVQKAVVRGGLLGEAGRKWDREESPVLRLYREAGMSESVSL